VVIFATNLGHCMNRPRTQYGMSVPSSTHSSAYTRTSRPMPPVTSTNPSSITKSIQSGSMNISTGNNTRTRPPSRFSQPSPERPIRTNSINTQRTKLPNQDRSVCFFLNSKKDFFHRIFFFRMFRQMESKIIICQIQQLLFIA
jgi:hypothetical protein